MLADDAYSADVSTPAQLGRQSHFACCAATTFAGAGRRTHMARIAAAGRNQHTGDRSKFWSREIDVVAPAVATSVRQPQQIDHSCGHCTVVAHMPRISGAERSSRQQRRKAVPDWPGRKYASTPRPEKANRFHCSRGRKRRHFPLKQADRPHNGTYGLRAVWRALGVRKGRPAAFVRVQVSVVGWHRPVLVAGRRHRARPCGLFPAGNF